MVISDNNYTTWTKCMGCIYCEEMGDNAEHTFFHCIKWQDEKNILLEQIGEFIPDNIVDAMLESHMK